MAGPVATDESVGPPKPKPPSGRHTFALLVAFYALAVPWGFRNVYIQLPSALDLMFPFILAGLLCWWAVIDARRRGRPIPLLARPWFFLGAAAMVPGYIVWSRRWRGAGWIVLHAVLWMVLASAVMIAGNLLLLGGQVPFP